MSARDFTVIKHGGAVRVHDTDDRTTSSEDAAMLPGEPIKSNTPASAGEFAIKLATGDPEVATDMMLGIAAKQSTETSSAEGEVEYISLIPNQTVLRAKAHTATNVNTAAKLLALKGHWVTCDLTSSAFTVNEDEATDPNVHGFQILGGDIVKGTLDFVVSSLATQAGTTI